MTARTAKKKSDDQPVEGTYRLAGVVHGSRVVFEDGTILKLRKLPEGALVLVDRK
jgi:hypothetical protein